MLVMPQVLEGKNLSKEILDSLPSRIDKIKSVASKAPTLAIINYYEDSASQIYIKRKIKVCEKLGIHVNYVQLEERDGCVHFVETIKKLSRDKSVDAIMVERPLPPACENLPAFETLSPEKDVDAVSVGNAGRLFLTKSIEEILNGGFFIPCTALAVVKILLKYGINPKGKKTAVVGRSSIVGRPLAHMLTAMDATVTLCHSKTENIAEILRNSEIVASAVGKPRWISTDMLKTKSVVIDVGTNIDDSGKMCGDVDFESAWRKVSAITPVPGGVGPVTLACLIEGVVKAAENSAFGKK